MKHVPVRILIALTHKAAFSVVPALTSAGRYSTGSPENSTYSVLEELENYQGVGGDSDSRILGRATV